MMQVIGDGTSWAQISVPTGRREIRAVAASLRRCGWRVKAFPMGPQVTDVGLLRLTMVDVRGHDVDRDIVRAVFRRYGIQVS